MKILVAGASGAIGQPLIRFLTKKGYEVFGITQSEAKASLIAAMGANPLILNVLDQEAVFDAVSTIKPDVLIDMLTHLPKEYTPESMRQAAEMDAKIRSEGGANLLSAAEKAGTRRYIVMSSGFLYAPGNGLADESTPWAFEATPGVAASSYLYANIEQRILYSSRIQGVALRFGFFYGPGTWYHPDGNVAEQVRKQQFPLIGQGIGVWNFVHIEDAAQAVVASVESAPGVYNIVNDEPSPMKQWLPGFARSIGAKPPPSLTVQEGLDQRGPDAVYYASMLRGASNAKAKRVLSFQPRTFDWLRH